MDFHRGDTDGLQCVQQGDAGMGIGAGIDDDAVLLSVGLLNGVHQVSLMVGLVQGDADAQFFGIGPDQITQIRIGCFAVDLRFADAEHVQVRPVDDKDVHCVTCFQWCRLLLRACRSQG